MIIVVFCSVSKTNNAPQRTYSNKIIYSVQSTAATTADVGVLFLSLRKIIIIIIRSAAAASKAFGRSKFVILCHIIILTYIDVVRSHCYCYDSYIIIIKYISFFFTYVFSVVSGTCVVSSVPRSNYTSSCEMSPFKKRNRTLRFCRYIVYAENRSDGAMHVCWVFYYYS